MERGDTTLRMKTCTTMPVPQLWGVINLTFDSFYAGSRVLSADALARAEAMLADGAAMIDVGAESTRPGAEAVAADAQLRVLLPFIDGVVKTYGSDTLLRISVDTRDISVMRACIEKGIKTINDVSGGSEAVFELVAQSGVDYVLMHTTGDPQNMQQSAVYSEVVSEVRQFLSNRTERLLSAGAKPQQIIWDTGIGFGKLPEHNLQLIARQHEFSRHGYRLLAGVSRKSFLGLLTGKKDAADRLIGTLAAQTYLTLRGLDILRVHDVKEMAETLLVIGAIQAYELHPA